MDGKVRASHEHDTLTAGVFLSLLRLRYRLVIMNRRWIQQAKAHRNDPEWLYEQLKGLDLALHRISNYFYGEALERLHPEIDKALSSVGCGPPEPTIKDGIAISLETDPSDEWDRE